jgi:Nif-specific regulatory protein
LVRSKLRADGIIGRSAALAKALEVAVVAAASDLPVLLLGESGVGKSAFARMIHESGPTKRARGPFIELNCAALPETLAESELFGAEKGAHSTANRRMPGKIAAAEGGTLLLDEIGELPPTIQAKLLGVLQSKRYFPLGGTVEQTADVRILAATNADLPALVAQKKFREDLYYRLHVLTARLPALRERREDIVPLADGFATAEGGPPLSSDARAALAASDWPGNVRELMATVQRGAAFARTDGAVHVEPRHLFPERSVAPSESAESATFAEATRRFQRELLRGALERAQGNVSEAARQLDLSRSRLYELLRDHDLLRGKK